MINQLSIWFQLTFNNIIFLNHIIFVNPALLQLISVGKTQSNITLFVWKNKPNHYCREIQNTSSLQYWLHQREKYAWSLSSNEREMKEWDVALLSNWPPLLSAMKSRSLESKCERQIITTHLLQSWSTTILKPVFNISEQLGSWIFHST